MAEEKRMLPIGVDDFEKLIKDDFYFVDKTRMIADLLRNRADVTLFTRPRRFGKSLNMSMLENFFEIGGDPSLFDGLAISNEKELCEKHMGKYPVVFLSLKDVEGDSFDKAMGQLRADIADVAFHFKYLLGSAVLDDLDKETIRELSNPHMEEQTIRGSLKTFTRLLEKHYGQKVILLIDEYDVPLQKAFYKGYYDEMVDLIRGMFGQAMKTNTSLQFAVLTGCLRISKESIFTGMNNLRVLTVSDVRFDEYFGFTDAEVRTMLEYYGNIDAYGAIKKWYDGYRFGRAQVYCPWDVINYMELLQANPKARPQNFWVNSSGNDVVRDFVRKMDVGAARRELESLVDGETVHKEIHPELTYRDMYSSTEHLWSLLYMTGYLTGGPDEVEYERGDEDYAEDACSENACSEDARSEDDYAEDECVYDGDADEDYADTPLYHLYIPNAEIRGIFKSEIKQMFREETKKDGESLERLCSALAAGDASGVEKAFNGYLNKVISVRDTMARKGSKENFYHGILLGILEYKAGWTVTSNREFGDGYGDILVETDDLSLGIVIEVKYSEGPTAAKMDEGVRLALAQIENRRYDAQLIEEGYRKVLKYGVACYKKRCRVALGEAQAAKLLARN